jgi:molybdopterin molybdotransferase
MHPRTDARNGKFPYGTIDDTQYNHNGIKPLTDVVDAEALILDRVETLPTRRVPLDAAAGCVLREPIQAERDQPPFDRVTMDGIAIAYDDWQDGIRDYEIVGVQAAGAEPLSLGSRGECVEIMTGSMLPAGADAVIPVERIARNGNTASVELTLDVVRRQYIHPRGSDRPANSTLLEPGTRLGPPELAIVASAGRSEVVVSAAPRVAVISTGDELVEPGEPVAAHQIRSSNDWAIASALRQHCGADVTRVLIKDQREQLLNRIAKLHDENDILILSGGVSMGRFDLVPGVLEQLGVGLVFHKIEQRPGRPMWFGTSRDSKPVFALPGNPVSTLVCLYRYVLPAIRRALGRPVAEAEYVRLAEAVNFAPDLAYFLPVVLTWTNDGSALAWPRATNTSGDFVSLANTTGFVELPRGSQTFPRYFAARLFRW